MARSKDDVFDAFTLADTLRHEHAHWRPLPVASPALAELRALSRDRDRLLESLQRVEAQLHALLDAYHPAATRPFSSIDRDITLAFIADYPTPQAAARIGERRMAVFCRRQSYRGRVDPAILAQRLKDNLLSGAAGTVAGKSHSVQVFAELLGLLNRQLPNYDHAPAWLARAGQIGRREVGQPPGASRPSSRRSGARRPAAATRTARSPRRPEARRGR